MSKKSNSVTESDSSPEENFVYLTPAFICETEDKIWRSCLSMPDLLSPAPMNHHSDENMSNQVSFLYDYYGMTEESRQDPPSPGHSMTSTDDKDVSNEGIDIPERQGGEFSGSSMRHSFPESGKSYSFSHQVSSVNKRSQSTSSYKSENASGSSSPVMNRAEDTLISKPLFPYVKRNIYSSNDKYIFVLEAQTSVVQKREEDSLTYLNKGQFYYITFESVQSSKFTRVKSIIHLVFRDEKDEMSELNNWKYWYNQQPNPNQRAFDIDKKVCQNIIGEVEECGYNALAFVWNPSLRVKVSLRINCLSTDFTPQKGVKGMPLHLQIDTYENLAETGILVHQAFCKIKVFRDKGAERKNKEESKTVGKRMVKFLKQDNMTVEVNPFQLANKVTVLTQSLEPLTRSFVFLPPKEGNSISSSADSDSPPPITNSCNYIAKIKERETKRGFNTALSNTNEYLENLDVYPKLKTPRVYRKKDIAVTIYVRKEEEKVYNALLLETPTLDELKEAVSIKYNIPQEMIRHVVKKTKKGILVNIDDQLVERFVDEDDFIIAIHFDNQLGLFEVVFNS